LGWPTSSWNGRDLDGVLESLEQLRVHRGQVHRDLECVSDPVTAVGGD
jgi:hypothetical protein